MIISISDGTVNVEGLTQQQIMDKIKYLEQRIRMSTNQNGTTHFCKNRIERVKNLKTYLN